MPVRSRYVDSRYFILGFLYWVIFTVRDFLTQDVFKPTYLLRCWESNPTQACFLRKHMTYLESIIKIAVFCLKKNYLKSTVNFINIYRARLLEINFRRHMLTFSWTILNGYGKETLLKPWLWKRLIDDIFFIWAESKENLNKFLKDLNEFYPNLK